MSFSLLFHIHLHNYLKPYSFFKIGTDHTYENTAANVENTLRYVQTCLLPTTQLLQTALLENPQLYISFLVSGTAIDLLQQHQPRGIAALQQLSQSPQVSFVTTPYYHSPAADYSQTEWHAQIRFHQATLESLFGKNSTVYMSPAAMPMSQEQLDSLATLGIQSVVVVPPSAAAEQVQLVPLHLALSQVIEKKFSDKQWEFYPLYADQYLNWVEQEIAKASQVVLGWDLQAFGTWNKADSGIFEFLRYFLKISAEKLTYKPLAALNPLVEHDANPAASRPPVIHTRLQTDALQKLFLLEERLSDTAIPPDWIKTWRSLQNLDYFLQMSPEGCMPAYRTPYDAYINYMNILSDFEMLVRFHQKNQANKKKK